MEAKSVRNMQSIIAVTNKHTAKLHHVGYLHIFIYRLNKTLLQRRHKFDRFSLWSLTVEMALEKSVFLSSITLYHHQRLTAEKVMSGGRNICAFKYAAHC